MKYPGIALALLCILLLTGCKSKDRKSQTDANGLYFDYHISGREGDDNLTLLLQFREDDEDGNGVELPSTSIVMIDGDTLHAEKTKTAGYFYELHKPITEFSGEHIIRVVVSGHTYEEPFQFEPVGLTTSPSETLARAPQVFQFSGVKDNDQLRVLITDTSVTNDVNRIENISNGQLRFEAEEWDQFTSGPLQIEFVREYERKLKNPPPAGGRISIEYNLKREYLLID